MLLSFTAICREVLDTYGEIDTGSNSQVGVVLLLF